MSTPGTQRYSRIMLTLMNGGTKLTRRLVEKRVKDLSKNGEEDTIDEFLLKNKAVILQQKLGRNKENVFFPPSGHTNLDYWDLCMFCFILEETCDLSHGIKMRIKNLLSIRNKLCHLNDPTLETIKFDVYTDQLDISFEKCLEEINDETFTEEMNALVQSLATDPLSIDDTLKAIHNLYRSEWTQREVLEKIGNGQDLTNRMIETLIEKVERLESRFPSGSSVDIPGIGMGIEVENCSAEEEKEILDTLEKYFNEVIEQKVSCPEEDLPNGVMHTVRESVRQVFQDFLRRGRPITIVKQKCLLLTIKCASVKSFLDMIRDYRTGDLSLQLSGIETAIKNLQGCGNVQLVNFIFKEEFIEVMDDLVSKLCKRVQETDHTAVQTSSNSENSIRVTLKFPTISERDTVQNRFETKLSVDEMNRIESDLRRMLNEERMSLTDKLVVKDDTVSCFALQSDTPAVDKNATGEEETQTRHSRRKAALCEEEDTSIPSLRRGSQQTLDESTHVFQSSIVKARCKGTQISFDDNNGDRQMIKNPLNPYQMMASNSAFECRDELAEKEESLVVVFKKHGIAGVQQFTTEILNKWRTFPFHIAVTGKGGAGKSTFINAIRGLKPGEEGAADVAVKKCTNTIKCYNHPKNDNIVFWDLPEVGTENFKRENYDYQVKLAKYDLFLILSSWRFLENDGWLAQLLNEMGKKFYFVRTNVYNDVSNEARCRAFPRRRDEILNEIRSDCLQSIKQYGIFDSYVYLIDNFETHDFDFNRLQANIIEDSPTWKREAIVFSFIGKAEELLFQKKKVLEKRIKFISLRTALTSAIPLPGLSSAVNPLALLDEIEFYIEQFGLNEDAIKRSAEMLGIGEEDLTKELQMKDLLMKKGLSAYCRGFVALGAVEEVSKFMLPILGSITTGVISYKSTNSLLTTVLEGLYHDALKISKKLSMHSAKPSLI